MDYACIDESKEHSTRLMYTFHFGSLEALLRFFMYLLYTFYGIALLTCGTNPVTSVCQSFLYKHYSLMQ